MNPCRSRFSAGQRQPIKGSSNPYHPGLQFKQVHETQPIYSARISRDYRAVGVKDDNEIIGSGLAQRQL